MRLQHVAWFGLALALSDVGSTLAINVGIGDLLFFALFTVACSVPGARTR
jgi:hypothetical protein